jgi:hypothetical protein
MPSPHRLRRTLLLLGACWLLLSTAWVARRWRAVYILEKAADSGELTMNWNIPFWLSPSGDEKWTRLWPTSHLTQISTEGYFTDARAVAWAVRVCGPMENLWVNRGDGAATVRPISISPSLQRELQDLHISLDEYAITVLLRESPKLQNLFIRNVPFSGAHFPTMPALETVIIARTPLSDTGLAAVLRCPALRQFLLNDSAVTAAGFRQVPQWKQKALTEFSIAAPGLTEEELHELRIMAVTLFPKGGMTIGRQLGAVP